MNTIQYSPRSGPLYATGVSLGPYESSTQRASRSLQPFLQGSLGDRPTDRPRYSVGNNRRHVTVGFQFRLLFFHVNRALFTWQKKSAVCQTVATAQIAPKICQGQPLTFESYCSRLHPNRFTFGGVIAERVKTVLLPPRVFPLFASNTFVTGTWVGILSKTDENVAIILKRLITSHLVIGCGQFK